MTTGELLEEEVYCAHIYRHKTMRIFNLFIVGTHICNGKEEVSKKGWLIGLTLQRCEYDVITVRLYSTVITLFSSFQWPPI
jgi:hypothetical protein